MFQFRLYGGTQVIDAGRVRAMLAANGLDAWAACVEEQLDRALLQQRHGDWDRWQRALDGLPSLGRGEAACVEGAVALKPESQPDDATRATLVEQLKQLHPWRKGPFRIADILVDTEWRSDWKWDRVKPHLAPLQDRLVLDVGCGNGYHCWRMAMDGARQVIGIDPTNVFLAQFLAIKKLMVSMAPTLAQRVELLPFGIEDLPPKLQQFDSVFSMGVLYHRRSPIDHLFELRHALRPGGELVLETLVIEGGDDQLLVPKGRYAKMRNVWFIPTTGMLHNWLERCGFSSVKTVDVTPTGTDEQRSTSWMTFESLADFLDPADNGLTIEGYPAPRRAVLIAEA